ncbi:hypothetical protein GCM10018790_73070 [Kitasatospora xanthocidica]|uniref:hypothetical protein n=1 Tax=Kitasatospora xanthocidica TaxID=83382 RepID=UPI001678E0F8|nr:hypothetical protein [Kitasatospora xanthocidica]GHF84884.1 hypothetical protein GCM10018790_73070 [Kitasatospora xanthocidica]
MLGDPFGPFGFGINRIVSTVQTNFSANDLVSAFGKQDVKVELQTLTAFASKIEALLAAMEGSAAAPYKLEEQKVETSHFASAKFDEATALTTAYGKVHTQLVKFHKDFVKQIQAMQTAVAKTQGNYTTNEDNTTADQNAVAKNAGVTSPTAGSSGSAPRSNAGL